MGLRTRWRQIPIRWRIYLLITMICMGMAILTSIFLLRSLGNNARRVEQETYLRILTSVKLLLESEMERVSTLANDWGAWDAMYQFVQNPQETFVEENLSADAFNSVNLDIGLVMDGSGKVVFAYKTPHAEDANIGNNPPPESVIQSMINAVNSVGHEQAKIGLIFVDGDKVLATLVPVTNNDASSTPNGVLLVGKALDTETLALISQRLDLPVVIELETDFDHGGQGVQAIGENLYLKTADEDATTGYVRVDTDFGEDLVLKVELPKSSGMFLSSFQIISVGLVILFIFLSGGGLVVVVQRAIFHRLGSLVKSLGVDSDPGTLQQDEITRLKKYLELVEEEKQTNWEMVNRMMALNLAEESFSRVLNNVSQVAASSLDFQTTLQTLADQLGEAMQADGCYVTLWNEETQMPIPGAASGDYREVYHEMQPQPGEATITSSLYQFKKTLLVPDVANSPYISPSVAAKFPAKSIIGLPLMVEERLLGGVLIAYNQPHPFDPEEVGRAEKLAGPLALIVSKALLHEDVVRANEELRAAYEDTLEGWSKAVDLRDNEVEGHTRRVTRLTIELAQRMGISGHELDTIRWGSILHGIGKLGVPDYILRKPGKYTPEEYEQMKLHTHYGRQFLEDISFLREAAVIPYTHHEKWDGSGYPEGLKGEEIPFGGRLFAVIDVWDALTQERYYKKAWPREEALAYLREQSGKQFDPQVVEVFCRMMEETSDDKASTKQAPI